MMHFHGCSSTSILVEKCFKNAKFEGNARGKMCLALGALPLDLSLEPPKGRCPLNPLVVAAPRPPLSNLKTNEEIGGENTLTKGDTFIPSLPNKCNLNSLDLPLSQVCDNLSLCLNMNKLLMNS